jgi:pre-60S factor REI1
LPPITSEVFTEKVLAAQASSTAAATRASYERSCRACERTYFSENAYNNHVKSQKHRAKVTMLQEGGVSLEDEANSIYSSTLSQEHAADSREDSAIDVDLEFSGVVGDMGNVSLRDDERKQTSQVGPQLLADGGEDEESSRDSATESGVPLQRCLFCNYDSPTLPLNVLHMERIHGMFIPERNFLVDLPGLIGSLHERIYEFHECLYCGKLKPTVFGLQTHMRDKGHCKIRFGTEDEQLEIGEFYDFTSTYSDYEGNSEQEQDQSNGVKLGEDSLAKGDSNEAEDADGWETDSSASSLDSADLTAVPLDQHIHQYERLDRHLHHSSQDPRPHHNRDGWHSHAHKHAHAAFYSDFELHLPSGRSVGHRSLFRYYRQNLHSHPSLTERQEQLAIGAAVDSDSDEASQQVARQNDGERGRALTTRANGGTGMVGVTEQKKREVRATEKRARRAEERERRRFQWGNNRQDNFQKHFRVSPP